MLLKLSWLWSTVDCSLLQSHNWMPADLEFDIDLISDQWFDGFLPLTMRRIKILFLNTILWCKYCIKLDSSLWIINFQRAWNYDIIILDSIFNRRNILICWFFSWLSLSWTLKNKISMNKFNFILFFILGDPWNQSSLFCAFPVLQILSWFISALIWFGFS